MKPLSTFAWDDVKLDPWPLPASNILEGSPDALGALVFITEDKTSCSGIWQCQPGRFRWEYTWNETIYVLAGKGEIRSEDGECCPIVPGKMLHFNEGAQIRLDHRGDGAQVLLPAVRTTLAALNLARDPWGESGVVQDGGFLRRRSGPPRPSTPADTGGRP